MERPLRSLRRDRVRPPGHLGGDRLHRRIDVRRRSVRSAKDAQWLADRFRRLPHHVQVDDVVSPRQFRHAGGGPGQRPVELGDPEEANRASKRDLLAKLAQNPRKFHQDGAPGCVIVCRLARMTDVRRQQDLSGARIGAFDPCLEDAQRTIGELRIDFTPQTDLFLGQRSEQAIRHPARDGERGDEVRNLLRSWEDANILHQVVAGRCAFGLRVVDHPDGPALGRRLDDPRPSSVGENERPGYVDSLVVFGRGSLAHVDEPPFGDASGGVRKNALRDLVEANQFTLLRPELHETPRADRPPRWRRPFVGLRSAIRRELVNPRCDARLVEQATDVVDAFVVARRCLSPVIAREPGGDLFGADARERFGQPLQELFELHGTSRCDSAGG